ncbi:hypothetical protein FACS189419_07680 [Planctomycetales bacterium]|nr:hypothetical protein FACS189419_07680 [Planctomycetales bacterium]
MQALVQSIAASLLFFGLSAAVFAQDTLQQRFLTEAPIGWSKIRKQIEANTAVDAPSGLLTEIGKSKAVTPPFQIRLMGQYELFSSLPQEDSPQYLEAINEGYSFSLRRNDSDAVFEIEDIAYDTNKYRTKHQWKHNHLQGCVPLFEGIMVEGAWLEDIFKSPDITITQVKEKKIGDELVVEVVFRGGYQVDRPSIFANGTVTFLPEKDWTLLSYTGENRDSKTNVVRATVTKTVEYQTFDTILFPKLTKVFYQRKDGSQSEYVQELGVPSRMENKEIFYLRHYGFGEIDIKPASKYYTLRVTTTLVGVMFIILGLILYLLSRRKQ